jgi:hypothetical protein
MCRGIYLPSSLDRTASFAEGLAGPDDWLSRRILSHSTIVLVSDLSSIPRLAPDQI